MSFEEVRLEMSCVRMMKVWLDQWVSEGETMR